MKKVLILITVLFFISCTVSTSDNVSVDAGDIKYVKDDRTGLCFGIVASRKAASFETTGLGVTCVPCEKVEHLIK